MTQQYSFHLKNNISELNKNLQLEISYFNTYILFLITIFIEAGFILAVLSTLIYIEPFGALSIGFFYGFLSIIFLKLTKRKLKVWGGLREELDKNSPDLFICGHSHILKVMYDKNREILHMNPGAAGNYGIHKVITMLRFDIEQGEVKNLEVIEFNRH